MRAFILAYLWVAPVITAHPRTMGMDATDLPTGTAGARIITTTGITITGIKRSFPDPEVKSVRLQEIKRQ